MQALSTAAYGMISAVNRFDKSAVNTVNSAGGGDSSSNDVIETVNRIQAHTDFTASAKMFQTADQMMGTLLDLKV